MAKRTANQQYYIVESLHDYNILVDTREIFLNGEFDDEDPGVDYRMAVRFTKNLRFLETQNDKHIIIHQHSIGGEEPSGMMIYDAIVNCQCPILFICHGEATSMGSIIPQACVAHGNAHRICMPNCYFLLHEGCTGLDTHCSRRERDAHVEKEKLLEKKMLDIYVQSMKEGNFFNGYTDKRIRSFIKRKFEQKGDWIIDARQAIDLGLVDAVLGDDNFETINNIIKEW
jgi:ATP-dependent Clp protease protease subunit